MRPIRLIALIAYLTAAVPALADGSHQWDIRPQPLAAALQRFAQQSGQQIVYYGDVSEGRRSQGVTGTLTAQEALIRLLAGTGLKFERVTQDTIAIIDPTAKPLSWKPEKVRDEGADGSSLWEQFRLAQATEGASAETTSAEKANGEQAADKGAAQLEEVVVTAQKREEREQDVPIKTASSTITTPCRA
jgi:iron complex outermembrane recepter protein